jgi:hypothetical protein
MNPSTRQSTVRKFYKEQLQKLYETSDSFADFFSECRIGRVQLLNIHSDVFDCVEIERPQQEIPQAVADAYSRHFWYSQHSLTDFYLVYVPVESQISFALLVQGYIDDGWDNSGWFIEIFDEYGQFLGAGRCDYETGDVKWMETPLKGCDFNSGSPEWIGNESSPEPVTQPMWSEELFVQHGASVTQEGTVTRYIMPNDD